METQIYRVMDAAGNIREIEGPKGATDSQIATQAERLLGPAKTPSRSDVEKQMMASGPADAKASDGKIYRFPNEMQAFGFSRSTQGTTPDPLSISRLVMEYGGKPAPEPIPQRMSWGDVPGQALSNAPQSFANMMVGIGNAIANPVDTLTGMANVAAGGLRNVMPDKIRAIIDRIDTNPEAAKRATDAANEFGGVYKQRYGSIEALKKTLAEDPVGAMADLSTLLSPGATLPGKTGAVFGTAAKVTNPMTPVAATLGLAGKAAGGAANIGYRALTPKTNLLMEASEGRAADLINALRNAPEIVPGSKPTAAQATAGTGLVRYQGLGADAAGVLPTQYLTREMEQAAARQTALGTVAGTEASLKAAEGVRSGTAGYLYPRAGRQIVQHDATLDGLMQRPSMQKAFDVANTLSQEFNQPFQIGRNTPAQVVPSPVLGANGLPIGSVTIPAQFAKYPVESLHRVKLVLDDMVKDPAKFALESTQSGAIKRTRDEFLKWLETNAPDYATARTTFAAQSKPINQMEVGQYLQAKLLSPLDENAPQRAGMFAQAVRDAPGTLKRATGEPRFQNLSDILTPQQVQTVEAIRDDLARMQQSKTMGQRGAKAEPDLTKAASAAQEGLKSPNIMVRVAAIANHIIDRLQGKIDKELAIQIATEMLNPADAARALERAMKVQARKDILSAPFRAGGSVLDYGMRSPALLFGGQMNNLMPSSENALVR